MKIPKLLLLFSLAFLTSSCASDGIIISQSDSVNHIYKSDSSINTMIVMTINMAHGRKNNFHQAFLEKNEIEENLDDIIRISNRENPHLVALQEADGPSFWSGKFNHVDYISRQTRLKDYFQGYHVNNMGLNYGTALLASKKLNYSKSHTFNSRSAISLAKGFVLSTVKWPGENDIYVDVISVHLDFLLDSVRQKQINELIKVLKEKDNQIIMMGDYNADPESIAFKSLIELLNLKAYKFNRDGLETFSRSNKRLDWILISKDMEFISYKVLPDNISDHSAVISEIALLR